MLFQIDESLKSGVEKVMEDTTSYTADSKDYREAVTAKLVENQMKFIAQKKGINPAQISEAASADVTNATGAGVSNWDPILVKMVRRSTPNMIAFDLAGVQPMTGPTGLIFAMRSRYTDQAGAEAFMDEADTAFSGSGAMAGLPDGFAADAFGAGDPVTGTATGKSMTTAVGEALGTESGTAWAEMAFTIEKTQVTAGTRALKANYSHELEHDLQQIHGMSARSELAAILSTEIQNETDREVIRAINIAAKLGCQNTTTTGIFDVSADADGRWLVERWKALVFQMEVEANAIAKRTRRGKANRILCSSNVASAMNMAGVLDYNPQMSAALNVDDTGNTFAGVLLGRFNVYIDPFAASDYVTLGYRGQNAWDAGIYFAPYVPLEMYEAIGENSLQPTIGFKSRYGIVANPFTENTISGAKAGKGLGQGENEYFTKFLVRNLTL